MRELLEDLIQRFNAKAATDPSLREELGDLTKTVLIELKDGTKYHFTLQDRKVAGLLDGGVDRADITISTDADTLRALILREMGPFKAYATGKIRFKGSIEDLARFRKFF
ncbi:MAG: SCP2 sterol-binding domain-containing protein [Thermoplasmata archaeon]|nr:SCP2 sterol-binding domain-containing protein [Thermoplasmata archaeon]